LTATDLIDSAHYVADSIDNEHINWADMTDLTTDGAVVWGNIAEGELADSTIISADIKDGEIAVADTKITAGRSLTWSTDDMVADAELYTDQDKVWFETPAVESMNDLFLGWMNAITITYVKCKTDAGTVSINLEDGSDNNILSAELVCDVGGQTSCASGCDVNTINTDYDNMTAKTEDIDLDISAVDTATELSLMIGYTIDD